MEAADHLGFIVAAYAAAAAVVLALIGWVAIDYHAQRRALADLERRGFSRRSEPMRSAPAMEQAKEGALARYRMGPQTFAGAASSGWYRSSCSSGWCCFF